jgi:hypothetical protein
MLSTCLSSCFVSCLVLSFFQQSNNSNSNSNKLVPFDSSDEGTPDRALALVVTNTPHFQSSLGRTDSNTQEMVVSGRHFSGDEMVEAMDGLLVSDCKESTGSVFATQDESDMMAIIQR